MPWITLSGVSWATPDGRNILSNLGLAFAQERTGLIGRNGAGKSILLKLIASQLAPSAGEIRIGGRAALMRQIVQAAPEETVADLLGVAPELALLRQAEAGRASVEQLAVIDWTLEERIAAVLAKTGLDAAADTRLANMSGGQRTRAALAAAIFSEPDFLLLDEPTNNLDRGGHQAVRDLLRAWRGGAIVVSHDRELLREMDAIVELSTLGARRYGGGWDAYRERKALELAAAERDLTRADRDLTQARRAAQTASEKTARRASSGSRKASRGGLPRIAHGLRKDKSQTTGGAQAELSERRIDEAESAVVSARQRIEILQPLSVTLPPSGLAANRQALRVDDVTAGFTQGCPLFRGLSFSIAGPERVAITGPNGSGKSTLMRIIAGDLAPLSGEVHVAVPFVMLDQRVSMLDPASTIRENFLRLNPDATENACRAALASFQFRADAALAKVATLSGGQMLRAGLACVLGGPAPPALLLLDEPTNHLDLAAIAKVEAGLSAYDGALLVVSHDEAFLAAIGIRRRIELGGAASAK